MHKVAFVTVTLQHYRLSFYDKLTQTDQNIKWNVYHGIQKNDHGRPAFKGDTNFQNETFIENTIKVGPFRIVHNKGLLKKIKKFDPDIIVLPGIAGNITNRLVANWGRRNKKRIIIWTCGWEPGLAKGAILSLKNAMVSSFFKKGDFHLTYSTKASQYTESMGIPSEIIDTCYNGIEIDHLLASETEVLEKSIEIRKQLKLDDYVTFLYVGGLIPEKRIDLLINSFSELRKTYNNIKLLIVGDGPEKPMMLKMLAQCDDNHITYLGRIVEGVDQYFASADCFVMPGIGGLALNQAMFWGKICIVSEADGTEDDLVIPDKTGFRFEKDSLPSIKNSMEEMIKLNQSKIDTFSKNAREIIINYSNTNHMVDKFSTTIKELLKEGPSSPVNETS